MDTLKDNYITLIQHYQLFRELNLKEVKFDDIPTKEDKEVVNLRGYFNAMQKEIYAHACIWFN